MAIHCPNCTSENLAGSIFCDNCGYDLRSTPSAQPAPAVAVTAATGASVPPAGVLCDACGQMNPPGSALCNTCGAQLLPASAAQPLQGPATFPGTDPPLGAIHPAAEAALPPEAPGAPVTITGTLLVLAANLQLAIPPGKQEVLLGREDPVSGVFPDINLDPYGGLEAGIGRRHARLVLQNGQLYLEDLNSVNGTLLNKVRLAPRQPSLLHSGDELRLGKLALLYLC